MQRNMYAFRHELAKVTAFFRVKANSSETNTDKKANEREMTENKMIKVPGRS